jgi:hypothetical protein
MRWQKWVATTLVLTVIVKPRLLLHRIGFQFTHVSIVKQNIVKMMAHHVPIVGLLTMVYMMRAMHSGIY